MAGVPVRVTTGGPGDYFYGDVGIRVNTFGMKKLQAGVTGEMLMPIMLEAIEPARLDAFTNWAYLTGASRDSIEVVPLEVGPRVARAALQVGGDKLINDPRNVQHKDYAPYLEFNGSPGGTPPGILSMAFHNNDAAMRAAIHAGVARLIQGLIA